MNGNTSMHDGHAHQEFPRFSFEVLQMAAPAATAGLLAITKAVDASGLEKDLTELVKLRVSQMNGCAFCVAFHLNTARSIGVHTDKLDLLTVWRDVTVFSERERAALGWAEALTSIHTPALGDTFADLLAYFTDAEAMHLAFTIGSINAWNRIAGGLHFEAPPILRS